MATRRKPARSATPRGRGSGRNRQAIPRRPVTTSREGAIVVGGIGMILAFVYNATTGMVIAGVALVVYMLDFMGRRNLSGRPPRQ